MLNQFDLNKAESKLYLSYFDDGVADLLAGLPVILFGLGMALGVKIFFIFAFLPIVLYLPLKHAITLPRMGYVKFAPERRRRISKNLMALFLVGLLTPLLIIVLSQGVLGRGLDLKSITNQYSLLLVGALMAAPYALFSILFGLMRFVGYAALILGGWFTAIYTIPYEGIPVAVAGMLISLVGMGLLARFLARTSPSAE